jgi:NAD(P)H dehydrogenase (quinone)
MVNVAVIYYSATGNVHQLAQDVAEGAQKAGATDVRLLRVPETAPDEAIKSNEDWKDHVARTQDVPRASNDDLEWADAIIFGTPTRYGNVTAQLKQFIDSTGPLWQQGALVDKVVSGFTSTQTRHGGQESTLLTLYNSMYHWGSIIVPLGYTDPIQFEAGNPYGLSHVSGDGEPDDQERQVAYLLAERVVNVARSLKGDDGEIDTVDESAADATG